MDGKRRQITKDGLAELQAELQERKTLKRAQLTAAVAEARSHGDLRENAAYDAAREDQMMNERRISILEDELRNVDVVQEDRRAVKDTVTVGSTVVVDFDGDEERYMIVGAIEAKPTEGKISNESPIGKALLGRRVGQEAVVSTPRGSSRLKIKRIE